MIHRHAFRKLNRTASHRKALLRNLATNLVLHNRIVTTLPKAKELKRVADKLVTLGKKNTLHARREAMGFLYAINREADHNAQKWTAVHKLFTELAPKYSERNGGYVRVVKLGARLGDKAPMAVVEFVEGGSIEAKAPTKKRRQTKKSTTAASAEAVAE